MNKRNTHPRPPKPPSPSNPMEICFKVGFTPDIDWEIIVDDHVDLVDVDSPGKDVGRD
jgi:hypothetical protein